MTDTSGALPPAGWYPDPYGAPYERWWDGAQWTAHTTETPAAPAAPAAPVAPQPVVETPVYQAPAQETPTFVTPAYQTPAVETPAYQPPAVESPAYQPPVVETPSYKLPPETPAYQPPALETPVYQAPVVETPPYQQPGYDPFAQPASAAPSYATPAFPAPASASGTDHAFDFGQLISGDSAANSTNNYAADGTDTFGSWAGETYEEPPRNSAATAGLALGILSFFLSAVAGIFGIIFSLVGMSNATKLQKDGVERTGRSKAFAGFLLSLVGSIVTGVAILYFFFPSVLGLAPTAQTPPATDDSSNIADDELTQNGNIALTVGAAGTINPDSASVAPVTFTVTAIQPNFECTAPAPAATVNGQFVAVTMEITTAADYQTGMTSGGPMHMAESDWEGYLADSADPLANSEAGASCIPAEQQLPADFPAGSTFSGVVVLDLDPAATSFSWSPSDVKDLDTTATRWEWALVAS